MGKNRNFENSRVKAKHALSVKENNDKARKLDQNYKMQIEKLKGAMDKIIQLANKYLLKVDIFDAIEKANIITIAKNQILENLKSHLSSLKDEINNKHSNLLPNFPMNSFLEDLEREDLTSIIRLRNVKISYVNSDTGFNYDRDLSHFRPKESLIENIEKLAKDFEAERRKVNNLRKETGLSFAEIMELDSTIDNFLNIYSDIIAMDPRSDTEKAKIYHEDSTHISNEIPTNGPVEEASNSIKTDSSTSSYLDFFKSPFSLFSNTEDKDFASITSIKINRKFLRDEPNHSEQEPTENQDLVVINQPSSSEAIELTDVLHMNMLHKHNQAEAQNIIELHKVFCFESVIAMQKFVIQNCKAKNHLGDQQKCIEYNRKADLATKNCDGIFPMRTNSDEILDEKLMHSVSESVVISNNGISYIGAGEEVYTHQHYSPQINHSFNSSGDSMLSGKVDIISSNESVIHNEL